jgi:hypothetical protein
MKVKFLIYIYILSLILIISCAPMEGELNITFYGNESQEGYKYIRITIDRIDIHARGQEWKIIGDDSYLMDIVVGEDDSSNYLGEFTYKLSKNILEPGEYTELRLRVVDVEVMNKYDNLIPVIIPAKNEEGYKFPGIINIENLYEDINIDLTFYPDQSIDSNDEENIFNLKGEMVVN